ncbi:anti-sigma factor [Phragmitibacter flavus]|uniref:Regulator of SigK n=1 Tax=Phragmitibacter flavus TaxID=2576071 RepID=A0A5R8K774_9BACT|nr:anti-sigma factor [Phragmitibacter flavus]TLD68217.1 anti-sigma factor [Phragmitibacter flavus]
MTEEQQTLAALHALGALLPEEAQAFEQAMAANAELRREFDELAQTAADFGRLVTPVAPPDSIKSRIFEEITKPTNTDEPDNEGGSDDPPFTSAAWSILSWGLAAAFAVTTSWLWSERDRLQKDVNNIATNEAKAREQLEGITNELAKWKQKTALAKMEIATLQSTVTEFQEGVAVVVWNAEKQEGILKLEKMPPVQANKDYQLWVVDPKKKDPVDAGVVRLDANGFAKIEFKPIDIISEATKFALSIEREGGVPKGEGPIVLIGP